MITGLICSKEQQRVLFSVLGQVTSYSRHNESDEGGPNTAKRRRMPEEVRAAFDRATDDHQFYRVRVYVLREFGYEVDTDRAKWFVIVDEHLPDTKAAFRSTIVYPEAYDPALAMQVISSARAQAIEYARFGLSWHPFKSRRLRKAIAQLVKQDTEHRDSAATSPDIPRFPAPTHSSADSAEESDIAADAIPATA